MIKTGFSFTYDGERKVFTADGVHRVDENLTVNCIRREYSKYGAAEWVVYFENTGTENTRVISDILDCDVVFDIGYPKEKFKVGHLAEKDSPCVIWQKGMIPGHLYNFTDDQSAEELKLHKNYFSYWDSLTHSFNNTTGRSSDGTMPFFTFDCKNHGYVFAIGWTGGWKADFTYAKNEATLSVKTGLQNKTNFYLVPGEKVRTSSILIMEYDTEKDGIDSGNKFRRLIKKHFSHRSGGKSNRDGLFAFELWGGLTSDRMVKRIGDLKAHDIKLEDLWIDAGWYGKCKNCDTPYDGDWFKYTGEWVVNKNIHPDNLEEVRRASNDAGLNMMLWFEPERVTIHAPIVKEHPEYFFKKSESDFIINYGMDEARNYIFDILSGYIEDYGMSCYRQDFNTDLNILFANTDAEDRKGISEIKHICGMYKLWDDLREKYPHLLIDNCSSGGRRFDIETLRRSVAFFRSDYQCAFNSNGEVYQAHNCGASHYLPYTGCTTKVKCDDYNFRAAYSASFGVACYNAIFQEMSEDDLKWLKKRTDEYLRIRKYYSCDFYNHGCSAYDSAGWSIFQYHDSECGNGIVLAFRREESPFESVKIEIGGVARSAVLDVENLNNGEKFSLCAASRLEIELPEKRSCVIFEYKTK